MSRKLTQEAFIAKVTAVHGGRYDYAKTVYAGSDNQITVTCPVHGDFEQRAYNHQAGRGCPACGVLQHGQSQALSLPDVVVRAREVHGDTYEYPGPYLGFGRKMPITCRTHGEFQQTPANHIAGKTGCPACHIERSRYTPASFYAKVAQRHQGRYTYDGFSGTEEPLYIICPEHGEFIQRANTHLAGSACPACATPGSKAEGDLAALLRPHTEVVLHATVGGVSVDLWLPEHRLAVEHNGERFHSDISPQGKPMPRDRHAVKQAAVEAAGARLIQVWGTELIKRRSQVKALLLRAIGVEQGSVVNARACQVEQVEHKVAAEFYDRHHIQGAPSGGVSFGLFDGGPLVACMTFSMTADRRGPAASTQELKLVRYASGPRVRGGAGKLLAHGRRIFPGHPVVSFSDPRLFTGAMYRALGFSQDRRLPPDYHVWVPSASQLYHKSAFQRARLDSWCRRLGREDLLPYDAATDPRTEWEMQDALGVGRVFGVGLVRWVHA